MATKNPRKTSALINAEKRIAELESQLKSAESSKDAWYRNYSEAKKEIDGIHDILDGLDIPRKKAGESYGPEYPLSVRLFAWATRRAETPLTSR